MQPPRLDDIRLFAAVCEAGGFRPAAQQFGLPASTVSDVVRRLEDRLAVRLLNRSTRGVMPTEAGRRLLETVRPAFALIGDAIDGLHNDAASPRGTLRLSVAGIAARYVLPPIVSEFLNAFPDVQIEVVVDDVVVDIVERGFDAAIRYEERVAADMVAVRLGPRVQHLVAAAAPAYLAAQGIPEHPKDLVNHRLIGHRLATGAIVVWEFERARQKVRVTPTGPLITPSIELRLAAAQAGCGLIYTFSEVLQPLLDTGQLIPVLEPWWQSFPGPVLCYHGRRHIPGPLRAFLSHIAPRP